MYYEKWFGKHVCMYIGVCKFMDFKIGGTLGTQNVLYLGLLFLGVDYYN